MYRKIFTLLALFLLGVNLVFATQPDINGEGLPGYDSGNSTGNVGIEVISSIIGQVIQLVAAIAVISLIVSGIMYMLSGGEEEKVKKAKTWIIWSLVGVFLSVSAWGIINMLNKITIS